MASSSSSFSLDRAPEGTFPTKPDDVLRGEELLTLSRAFLGDVDRLAVPGAGPVGAAGTGHVEDCAVAPVDTQHRFPGEGLGQPREGPSPV
mmetsp:Transcript_71743/g.221576  ORF Transcript_71743/g.221576 Transcript_71743/m.221576 type:complete len:91 (-) Transcript_71743:153-425(-)